MSPLRKTALVTGGARRLGARICHGLAGAGFRVAVHYHNSVEDAAALEGAILLAHGPGSAASFRADLSDPDGREALVEAVAEKFGRLDLLVNNASLFTRTDIDSVTMEDFHRQQTIHVEAPAHLSLLCRKLLAGGAPGGIINILDIFADFPRKGFLPYCAAKAGLKAVTRQLALELAPDVLVNGVAPGAILEPEGGLDEKTMANILARIPMGRFGQAADVAEAVVFLAKARYITGQTLAVDGGRSINI